MKKSALVMALLVIFTGCQNVKSKSADVKTFNHSMKDLQETLTEILPLVADRSQYNSAANKETIDRDVEKLLELSKNVSHHPSVALKDPSVTFISQAFTEDLERIDESLKAGKREFARYNLMNLTAYCIECHTRTSTGPSFHSPALERTLSKLTGLERGEFLLATRQFDAAYQEFSEFIDEKIQKKNDFFALDKAVRHVLAITVKYLKDPKKSLEVVEKIRNAKGIPYYLKQNAIGWETAIRDWSKEKKPRNNSAAEIMNRVREWVRKGQQMSVGMVDRGGDIYFLRALSDLHLILASPLKPDQQGEALYLTGLSYEIVGDDSAAAPLHLDYYATCVRKAPHSSWAQKCFKRYEESIYFGYTGSSGVQLPEDESRKLERLRALAFEPEKK